MKTLSKALALMFVTSVFAQAEVWIKPPYKPDENHLPKETIVPREAQEEAPKDIKQPKQHQKQKKIDGEKALKKIDNETDGTMKLNQ